MLRATFRIPPLVRTFAKVARLTSRQYIYLYSTHCSDRRLNMKIPYVIMLMAAAMLGGLSLIFFVL